MATVSARRPNVRAPRKSSASSKTGKTAHNDQTVIQLHILFVKNSSELTSNRQTDADTPDSAISLPVVRRTKPKTSNARDLAGRLTGEAAPGLLYAPTTQCTVDDVQMFADFFENYYPASLEVWRDVTYVRRLMDVTPSTPVLERARRTIGLTHLASTTKDARLIRESRVSYGRLLGMLQFSLAFPAKFRTAQEIRELVASVALLTHISDLSGATAHGDDSWTAHSECVVFATRLVESE